MNKHDEFWRHEATKEDYADPNISTEAQLEYLKKNIAPAVFADDGSILEFGCGYGRLTREIKKAFPGSFVCGIDINPKILKQAEEYSGYRKGKSNPAKYPFYYCMDTIRPNMPTMSAIYSVQVLQHMTNKRKQQFIQEAAANLKRAGVLIFQYVEGISDTFLKHDAKFTDVADWCRSAGLEIASVEYDLIVPRWTWVTAVKE